MNTLSFRSELSRKSLKRLQKGAFPRQWIFLGEIDRQSIIVCRCTECGRLYLEENPEKPGVYYLYEKPDS